MTTIAENVSKARGLRQLGREITIIKVGKREVVFSCAATDDSKAPYTGRLKYNGRDNYTGECSCPHWVNSQLNNPAYPYGTKKVGGNAHCKHLAYAADMCADGLVDGLEKVTLWVIDNRIVAVTYNEDVTMSSKADYKRSSEWLMSKGFTVAMRDGPLPTLSFATLESWEK